MWLALLVGFAVWGHPHDCDVKTISAMEWVESRGNTMAVGRAGERGLLQVIPKWSRFPGWALHIPAVNRAEGCRILTRWKARAKGNKVLALQAYNGGNVGLHDRCSRCRSYARAVLRRE